MNFDLFYTALLKSRLLLFSFHYFVIGPDNSNGKINLKKNATVLSFTETRLSRHTRKVHTDDDNFAIV